MDTVQKYPFGLPPPQGMDIVDDFLKKTAENTGPDQIVIAMGLINIPPQEHFCSLSKFGTINTLCGSLLW